MSEINELILDDEFDEETEIEPDIVPKTDYEIENAYKNLSFRVIYQSNNFFLPQIRELINGREVINLRPEYQRRLRWSIKKKSQLIESLLLNIPIPPIFLYESELARYEVMDGQQRLNAIHEFMENNYNLTGLEKLSFLNGKSYKRLPPTLRRGLERASISAVVLLQETRSDNDPYAVRRYVFERLNTGGEKLNPQEIRNSIYRGAFNDLIVKLTRNSTFCRIFGIPAYTETDENEYYENPERQKNSLYARMNDCQIVLRFFSLVKDEYLKGSMHTILDNCMKRYQKVSPEVLVELKSDFETTINSCDVIFSRKPFLLPPDEKGYQRVSVALYDACMVAVFRCREKIPYMLESQVAIIAGVNDALEKDFDLMTGKANTALAIKLRIAKIVDILDAVIKS